MGGSSFDSSLADSQADSNRLNLSPAVSGANPARPLPSELVSIKVELYDSEVASAWLSAKLLSKEEPPIAVGEPITKGSIVTR